MDEYPKNHPNLPKSPVFPQAVKEYLYRHASALRHGKFFDLEEDGSGDDELFEVAGFDDECDEMYPSEPEDNGFGIFGRNDREHKKNPDDVANAAKKQEKERKKRESLSSYWILYRICYSPSVARELQQLVFEGLNDLRLQASLSGAEVETEIYAYIIQLELFLQSQGPEVYDDEDVSIKELFQIFLEIINLDDRDEQKHYLSAQTQLALARYFMHRYTQTSAPDARENIEEMMNFIGDPVLRLEYLIRLYQSALFTGERVILRDIHLQIVSLQRYLHAKKVRLPDEILELLNIKWSLSLLPPSGGTDHSNIEPESIPKHIYANLISDLRNSANGLNRDQAQELILNAVSMLNTIDWDTYKYAVVSIALYFDNKDYLGKILLRALIEVDNELIGYILNGEFLSNTEIVQVLASYFGVAKWEYCEEAQWKIDEKNE